MPNKHAAEKDLRKNKRRAAHNLRIRKNVKALWKAGRELITQGKKNEAAEKIKILQQALDKAAKRHVIHVNKARRQKSALMKLVNAK
mgnify:CR=1 FL=1